MVMNACFACAWEIHMGVGSENKPMLILLILANIAAITAYQTYMREDITFTHELFQKKGLKWNFMPAAFLSYDWQHDTETKSSSSGNAVSSVGTEHAEENLYFLTVILLQGVKIHVPHSCLPGTNKQVVKK